MGIKWALRMAQRDGRKSVRRLLLYISSTSIGIAVLVAAGGFRHNIEEAIRRNARPLAGGDIVLRHRQPFDPAARTFFKTLPFPQIEEVELNTMLFVPDKMGRLMELHAIEKGFPLYGEVKTSPPGILPELHQGPHVLLEQTVLNEYGLRVGDEITFGQSKFKIIGALTLAPGEAMTSVFSAPVAYIALPQLGGTKLIQQQSLARYHYYFEISDAAVLTQILDQLKPMAEEKGWRVRTVEDQQRSLGRRATNATRFLKFMAMMTLILGGIGVASILTVYAKEKQAMAATLKCLGTRQRDVLMIFLFQAAFLGLAGSLLGCILGVVLQAALPLVLHRLVHVEIPFLISWGSIGSGFAIGFAVTFLFALLPLLRLGGIPPLAALRSAYEPERSATRDPGVWAVGFLLMLLLFLFARMQTARWLLAALVPTGLLIAFIFVGGATRLFLKGIQTQRKPSWPFTLRHGLANLYRPNNQTHIFVTALGLGGALICCVSFLNSSLLRHISFSTTGEQPTLALFDIQPDQRQPLRQKISSHHMPILEDVPFVSMRIESIKGKPVSALTESSWAHRREYRSSYRSHLGRGEELVSGEWPPAPWKEGDPVPISIEKGIAEELAVKMADTIEFNVQGVIINTVVAAIRTVDWLQLRPNFFVIFPEGVLEDAPQFFVMMARAQTIEASADLQRDARAEFSNVSVIDLRMVLETLNTYFGYVATALKFMALFVVMTGLVILTGALISGRFERLKEARLLRTLGASHGQIRSIHLVEYGLIGFFSGGLSLIMGAVGSYFAAKYFFQIDLFIDPLLAGMIFAGMVGMSLLTGAIVMSFRSWSAGRLLF